MTTQPDLFPTPPKVDLFLSVFVDGVFKVTEGMYHGDHEAQAARVGSRNGHQWCHMFAPEESPQHLHAFAAKLGMKRQWFDKDHYDLTPKKRALAVRMGAIETDIRTYSFMRRSRRPQVESLPLHEDAGGRVDGEPEAGLLYLASIETVRGAQPDPALVLDVLAARWPKSVAAVVRKRCF